jgi:hypothetical protein
MIKTYDDTSTTSIVNIVYETNSMEKDTDSYQNVRFDRYHWKNVPWI